MTGVPGEGPEASGRITSQPRLAVEAGRKVYAEKALRVGKKSCLTVARNEHVLWLVYFAR